MKPLYKPELEHLVGKIKADLSSKQDKLTAGDNITITSNTISATDTVYDDTSIRTELGKKADKTYVDNKVKADVPAGAVFTDTVYTHPASHPPSIITQNASNRFVTDAEKAAWSGKADKSYVGTAIETAIGNAIAASY